MESITYDLVLNIGASIISALGGVLLAFAVRRWYWDRCFKGWVVNVTKNGQEKVNRAISPRKAKEIYEEPSDLSVFLKGVISPYGYIRGDILEEGPKLDLLKTIENEDRYIGFKTWRIPWRIHRTYVINLDKNPREAAPPPVCVLAEFPGNITPKNTNVDDETCPVAQFLLQRPRPDATDATSKMAAL